MIQHDSDTVARRGLPVTPRDAAWSLALVSVATAAWLVRWLVASPRGTGDAFWYTRLAYTYLGTSPQDAIARAAALVERLGIESAHAITELVPTVDPRYQAIFAGRPWYPATGALLIPAAGADAMIWSVAFAGVLTGIVVGWLVTRLTGSRLAGMAALVLFYVLPSGQFAAQVMADPWALLFWTVGLAACSLYLLSGSRRTLLGVLIASALLGTAKSADLVVLATTLVLSAAVLWLGRARYGAAAARRAASAAAASSLVAGGVLAVSAMLGLPGLQTTLQDLLTAHFTKPDVANPYRALLRLDLRRLPSWGADLLRLPGVLLLLAASAIGLLRSSQSWTMPWLVGAPTCVLLVLVHPVGSEIPRLMSPAWVCVAVGLAVWVPELGSAVRSRLHEPAAAGDGADG